MYKRPPRTPTQQTWDGMKNRCRNPSHPKYHLYGGRGITVCPQWSGRNGFKQFLADMGERPEGMTLDRHPNADGNYEPGNCRWATLKQQARGRRNMPRLTAFGKTQTIAEWCEEYAISIKAVRMRLRRGWTLEDALTHDAVLTRTGWQRVPRLYTGAREWLK